jgi:hypothetical protein
MDRRLSRRNLALSIAALVLALPGVTACGFNYATDRDYTPANGVNDRSGLVDVLNAVIVSSTEGSGTFITSLSNNTRTETISLDSLSFVADPTAQVAPFSPIAVKPRGLVNLADGLGIKVQGEFKTGDFVPVSVGFDNGETADIRVLVVTADDEYTGLDNGKGTPAPASAS